MPPFPAVASVLLTALAVGASLLPFSAAGAVGASLPPSSTVGASFLPSSASLLPSSTVGASWLPYSAVGVPPPRPWGFPLLGRGGSPSSAVASVLVMILAMGTFFAPLLGRGVRGRNNPARADRIGHIARPHRPRHDPVGQGGSCTPLSENPPRSLRRAHSADSRGWRSTVPRASTLDRSKRSA